MVIMLATALLGSSPILAQVKVVKLPPTVVVKLDTATVAKSVSTATQNESLDAEHTAILKFDKVKVDFGTFYDTEVQTATFVYRNLGGVPLEIKQVYASCGCTVPHFEKKKVAPGESGVITVTYNGKGRFPGKMRNTIVVKSNARNRTERVYIEGKMRVAKPVKKAYENDSLSRVL